jgi:iron(III) transport system ATP-binding protein
MTPKAGEVRFTEVTKKYGSVVAVDAISFVVEAGTLVTLLGPSGCGKTTTLRMIAGLEMSSSGKIFIGGEDVTARSATDRDVTMVFQSYALFPHMTVLENVCYGLISSGKKKREAEEAARAGLELVGLGDFGARLPSALSGGQQQRVAVARALVLEPKVLLFDEPLSNLDAKLRRKMREDIRELQQKLGVTSVYVTHDREEALSVSDKIIVMDRAKIVQEGSPRDLYERPVSAFVSQFLGEATMLRGELQRTGGGDKGTVRVGGVTLELEHRDLASGIVWVAVRPQAITLEPSNAGGGISATIKKSTYLGSHYEYTLSTEAGELFAVSPQAHLAGAKVNVRLEEAGIVLLPA